MDHVSEQTPWQLLGGYWCKRDDLYSYAGVSGGKVRTCQYLCLLAAEGEPPRGGVVTAGSRHSPQVEIVAHIASHLGLHCRCHVPAGDDTPQLLAAEAMGAEVVRHRPGHNSVIVSRAREDAKARHWAEIPFGMETPAAVQMTAGQVREVPAEVQRLVVPVGSGMSLAGILDGLTRGPRPDLPVLGIRVGADPMRRLDKYYAPARWQMHAGLLELRDAGVPYHERVEAELGGVLLDPVYEAKCMAHLEPGDGLWIVGVRGG